MLLGSFTSYCCNNIVSTCVSLDAYLFFRALELGNKTELFDYSAFFRFGPSVVGEMEGGWNFPLTSYCNVKCFSIFL